MRFQIVSNPTPQVKLRQGWHANECGSDGEYLDIERSVFSCTRVEDPEGESTYVDMRVTFHQCAPDEYDSAYVTFQMNVPSGDHQEGGFQINVSVEEALRLCMEPI